VILYQKHIALVAKKSANVVKTDIVRNINGDLAGDLTGDLPGDPVANILYSCIKTAKMLYQKIYANARDLSQQTPGSNGRRP
jgi:hypothetical protein